MTQFIIFNFQFLMPQVILFILGICVGSFLNVVIDRIPNGKSIITGRSHCDFCKHSLAWYDLFPVASYLLLLGKCRYCRCSLSIQYPLIELLSGLSLVVLWQMSSVSTLQQAVIFFLHALLLLTGFALTIMDIKYQILSDKLLVFFFLISLLLVGMQTAAFFPLFFGIGLLSALPFFLLFFVSKGRAMGFGDVKLGFCLGFLLGSNVLIAFYIACITGAIGGVALLILKKKSFHTETIAFGPFLLLGALIASLWGNELWSIAQRVLGI